MTGTGQFAQFARHSASATTRLATLGVLAVSGCYSTQPVPDAGVLRDAPAIDAPSIDDTPASVPDIGPDAWRWTRDAGPVTRRGSIYWLFEQDPTRTDWELPGLYVLVETDMDGRRRRAWSIPDATVARLGDAAWDSNITVALDGRVHVGIMPGYAYTEDMPPPYHLLVRIDPDTDVHEVLSPPEVITGGFGQSLPIVDGNGYYFGLRQGRWLLRWIPDTGALDVRDVAFPVTGLVERGPGATPWGALLAQDQHDGVRCRPREIWDATLDCQCEFDPVTLERVSCDLERAYDPDLADLPAGASAFGTAYAGRGGGAVWVKDRLGRESARVELTAAECSPVSFDSSIDREIVVACGEQGTAIVFRSDLMERRTVVPEYTSPVRVVAIAFSDPYRE